MVERTTLLEFFDRWCAAQPTPALIDARGGAEIRLPAPEVARRVAGLAQGLGNLGVGRGDRVAVMSWNRPEWHIVDFAVQHLGAVLVPLYPTLLAPQAAQILHDSGARVVVVDNDEQLAKVQVVRGDCPALERVRRRGATSRRAAPKPRPETSRRSSTPRARPASRRGRC
ncbi:MAG: AMP-dependent synthetase and ligase [Acidobacteria bacterium]|nr:AMP-dependent synthetase and ligase [Acidobacteriota bacterium]